MKRKLKLRLLFVFTAIVLLVWSFYVIRLMTGYKIAGEVNSLEKLPYFDEYLFGLNIDGNIQYVCRVNTRMTLCLLTGQISEENIKDFFGSRLVLRAVDSDMMNYWKAQLDLFGMSLDEYSMDNYKNGYFDNDNMQVKLLYYPSTSVFYLLISEFKSG